MLHLALLQRWAFEHTEPAVWIDRWYSSVFAIFASSASGWRFFLTSAEVLQTHKSVINCHNSFQVGCLLIPIRIPIGTKNLGKPPLLFFVRILYCANKFSTQKYRVQVFVNVAYRNPQRLNKFVLELKYDRSQLFLYFYTAFISFSRLPS